MKFFLVPLYKDVKRCVLARYVLFVQIKGLDNLLQMNVDQKNPLLIDLANMNEKQTT